MKSLRLTMVLLCLFAMHLANAQDYSIQKTIDEQVWLPFIKTYSAFDGEGFNALHTKNVLRAGPWGILQGEEYHTANLKNSSQAKAAGEQRSIAFRFEHRVAKADVAYEVGYYKVISTRNGEKRIFYGRFDVVLRKVDGSWKIAQDWDVDDINGEKLTEADFLGKEANPVIYK